MIRVAYVLTPVQFGGSERVNLMFLRNVDRDRFDIRPILIIRPWEDDNFFVKQVEGFGYPIEKIPVAGKPRSQGKDYFRIIRCFGLIYSYAKRNSFDLMHTHGYLADIIGICVAKTLRMPIISTCHGFISNDFKLKIYNLLDRKALRLFDKIICVSDQIKSDLIKNGIKKNKVVTIENAVEYKSGHRLFKEIGESRRRLMNIKKEEFVVGYVGRLSKEKGLDLLIMAASLLKKSSIPVKLVIIGEGPERERLEGLIRREKIEAEVNLIGFESNTENWMSVMDVFVLPSLTEGTPMALLEAMAYGIPCVATAVGGVPRVIDSGNDGLLVSPGKPEDIAKAILTLYSNVYLREVISKRSKEKIKSKYNIKQWIRRIEAEYLQTLGFGS